MIDLAILAPREQGKPPGQPFRTVEQADGSIWIAFYRTRSGLLLRFPKLADCEISADASRVTMAAVPGVSEATTEHLYLNQVLPLALSKSCHLVLHASAVEVGPHAIAFLAESGRGKSTLATAFAVNGYRFLADDGLVLGPGPQGHLAFPNHPSIRLWEDSHKQLVGGAADVAPAVDYTPKARLLAGTALRHCDEPRPLRALYLLGDGSAAGIAIRQLGKAEALVALAGSAFLLDVEDKELVRAQFNRLSVLADTVRCYHLDYPRHYDDVGCLLAAIMVHADSVSL